MADDVQSTSMWGSHGSVRSCTSAGAIQVKSTIGNTSSPKDTCVQAWRWRRTWESSSPLTFTSDLKYSQQCTQAYTKANKILGMIFKRTIAYKSTGILLQLYKSLVRPHLEYCTAAWTPHYQKDKKLLEKIQTLYSDDQLPYKMRLKSLNLWSLEDRGVRADLIEVFKMYHGLSVVDIDTFFKWTNPAVQGLSLIHI